MTTKTHILVVEDNALIYKRLKMMLQDHHYFVDDYTLSVQEAIGRINHCRPDLVLLDINLQGDQNGIYLGQLLKKEYHIPFIYVTEFDDDQTFYNALNTGHDDFVPKNDINLQLDDLIIQTKPHLDERKLTRAIQNTLNRASVTKPQIIKNGVMGLSGYLDEIKDMSYRDIIKVPVKYENIVFFTVKPYTDKNKKTAVLKANYVWFQTNQEGQGYFLKTSLKDILKTLPYNFVRINESYIINISADYLKGRLNGCKILINDTALVVSKTYKNEVDNRIRHFYQ